VKVETGRGKGAKRLAGPKLRIDRGGMGGGELVPYNDALDLSDKDSRSIRWGEGWHWLEDRYEWDDFPLAEIVYGNNPHFLMERWHIFHYCIFACNRPDCEESCIGKGEEPGDEFIIYKAYLDSCEEEAHVFMHEIGHNFYLEHCDNHCAMEESGGPLNYCSSCWNKISENGLSDHIGLQWISRHEFIDRDGKKWTNSGYIN